MQRTSDLAVVFGIESSIFFLDRIRNNLETKFMKDQQNCMLQIRAKQRGTIHETDQILCTKNPAYLSEEMTQMMKKH